MASFTDQKQRIATEHECHVRYGGVPSGKRFKCYLCAHKFVVGDKWRWVYSLRRGCCSLLVCEACDGTNEEVLDKWEALNKEYRSDKFWALRDY